MVGFCFFCHYDNDVKGVLIIVFFIKIIEKNVKLNENLIFRQIYVDVCNMYLLKEACSSIF